MAHRCDQGRAVSVLAILVAALALTGCGGGTQPAAPPPPPATSSPGQAQASACTEVGSAARTLSSQVSGLINGQTSRNQVTAAAQQLYATLTAARNTIKKEAQGDIDAARTAVEQLQSALNSQPIDLGAARAAASQALAAVQRALDICGTPAPTTSPLPQVPPTR